MSLQLRLERPEDRFPVRQVPRLRIPAKRLHRRVQQRTKPRRVQFDRIVRRLGHSQRVLQPEVGRVLQVSLERGRANAAPQPLPLYVCLRGIRWQPERCIQPMLRRDVPNGLRPRRPHLLQQVIEATGAARRAQQRVPASLRAQHQQPGRPQPIALIVVPGDNHIHPPALSPLAPHQLQRAGCLGKLLRRRTQPQRRPQRRR
jgi:hypothetical protein